MIIQLKQNIIYLIIEQIIVVHIEHIENYCTLSLYHNDWYKISDLSIIIIYFDKFFLIITGFNWKLYVYFWNVFLISKYIFYF